VKPSNLLLAADGRVKLLDLGLARFLQDQIGDGTLTREGLGMGTPDYAAPEQFRDAHKADPRSDIYSLGCTLYHLIAGRVPFPGSSLSQKVQAHEAGEPSPLEDFCPDMPAGLALLVRRMLAKRPADRFQSMAEVADALTPFVATSSPSFRAISASATWDGSRLATMTVMPRRRRSALVAAGAGLVLLLVAGTIVSIGIAGGWFHQNETQLAQATEPGAPTSPATGAPDTGKQPHLPVPQNEDDPNVLTVSQQEKDGAKYGSINAALDKVQPGQTIRVLDSGVYREILAINSPSQHHDITLEAPHHATLEQGIDRGNGVLIQGVAGVTFRGFRLRSTAKNIAFLIAVAGHAPATTLEQLEVVGGTTAALFGVEVEQLSLAENEPPLIIRDCLFQHMGVGIRLSGLKNDFRTPEPNRRVVIRNNRFARCNQPVGIRGSFRDVLVVGNLIWNASETGIQVQNVLPDSSNLLIANNTLLECTKGIVLRDDKDKKIWGSDIRVRNNLIVGSQQEDVVFMDTSPGTGEDRGDGDGSALLKAWRFDHNGREWKPASGVSPAKTWVPAGGSDLPSHQLKLRSRDVNQAGFLVPDKESALATAGAGNEDPSLPVYVGALPPEGTDPWDWDRTRRMPRDAQLLTVSKESSGGGVYRTLNEALKKVKPWATIRALDAATYTETIALDDRDRLTGLWLEAPKRATILLKSATEPALEIRNVSDVTVRGFRLRQEGQGNDGIVRSLVQVRGECRGLHLEDLELQAQVQTYSMVFRDVVGSADNRFACNVVASRAAN
jgi:hypothetical protein